MTAARAKCGAPPPPVRGPIPADACYAKRMRHEVTHGLGLDLAKKAVRAATESYAVRFAKYSPKTVWESDARAKVAFSVPGGTLDGSLEIKSDVVVFELDIPFLLRPFKKRALEIVEGEINIWVDKAKKGELG